MLWSNGAALLVMDTNDESDLHTHSRQHSLSICNQQQEHVIWHNKGWRPVRSTQGQGELVDTEHVVMGIMPHRSCEAALGILLTLVNGIRSASSSNGASTWPFRDVILFSSVL